MESWERSQIQLLKVQLASMNAQNAVLSEENVQLKHKLNCLTKVERATSTVNVEAKIRAFQLEDECERILENFEGLKKKYNKLHQAYLEKVKRCKALEEVFKNQKTLTGLVMKSANGRQKDHKMLVEANSSAQVETITLAAKVARLQTYLDEAYDIIDELEFELESIDLLEAENQHLRKELDSLKSRKLTEPLAVADGEEPIARPERGEHDIATDECAADLSPCECCFSDDDVDSDVLERAVLTDSLIESAEAETKCLRRELLRSRLEKILRAKSEAKEE